MVGWLEKGLDFHVSKDEEGVGGQVGSPGVKRLSQSCTEKALGMRVVSHARILDVDAHGAAAQNAIRSAGQNQEEDAQG